jgi:hypothetical protein
LKKHSPAEFYIAPHASAAMIEASVDAIIGKRTLAPDADPR